MKPSSGEAETFPLVSLSRSFRAKESCPSSCPLHPPHHVSGWLLTPRVRTVQSQHKGSGTRGHHQKKARHGQRAGAMPLQARSKSRSQLLPSPRGGNSSLDSGIRPELLISSTLALSQQSSESTKNVCAALPASRESAELALGPSFPGSRSSRVSWARALAEIAPKTRTSCAPSTYVRVAKHLLQNHIPDHCADATSGMDCGVVLATVH